MGRIGWCVPGLDDAGFMDSVKGRAGVSCYFFDRSTGRVNPLSGSTQSPFFSPNVSGQANVYFSVPQIEEKDVDFGKTFTVSLIVDSLSGKSFDSYLRFDDGTHTTTYERVRHEPAPGEAVRRSAFGGVVELTREGEGDAVRVNARIVQPFATVGGSTS